MTLMVGIRKNDIAETRLSHNHNQTLSFTTTVCKRVDNEPAIVIERVKGHKHDFTS